MFRFNKSASDWLCSTWSRISSHISKRSIFVERRKFMSISDTNAINQSIFFVWRVKENSVAINSWVYDHLIVRGILGKHITSFNDVFSLCGHLFVRHKEKRPSNENSAPYLCVCVWNDEKILTIARNESNSRQSWEIKGREREKKMNRQFEMDKTNNEKSLNDAFPLLFTLFFYIFSLPSYAQPQEVFNDFFFYLHEQKHEFHNSHEIYTKI